MTIQTISLNLLQLSLLVGANLSSIPTQPSEEVSLMHPKDLCKEMLEKLSNSSSAFTQCVTKNAKPIFMCRNCVHDFINVKSYYSALEHSKSNGINCKDLLTSQDKVDIIKTTVDHILSDTGLWARGFCSYCYTSPLDHHSTLTENTKTFFALHAAVGDCFQSNPSNYKTESGKSLACTDCAGEYYNLLHFYKRTFIRGNEGFSYVDHICYDVLDTMNTTQQMWGTGHYHCGRKMQVNLTLIAAVLMVLATPIAFYMLACGCQERAHERLVTQHHINEILTQAQPPGTYIDHTTEVQPGSEMDSMLYPGILAARARRPSITQKLRMVASSLLDEVA